MRKYIFWLLGVILVTVAAFLFVFAPITFTPRKNPSDASRYLRTIGTKGHWDPASPNQHATFTLGGKYPVYMYVPQHDLSLGLDLRGGMRVDLQIPNRGEFNFTIKNPDTDVAAIGAKKDLLTNAVRQQLGWKSAPSDPTSADPNDIASQTLQVDYTGDTATITTQADSSADAQAQLQKITAAMTTVFPGSHAFTIPDASKVFQSAKDMQGQVSTILEKRVNPDGTREVSANAKGDDQIVLEIPGEKDPDHVKDLLKADAQLSFALLPNDIDVQDNPNSQGTTVYDKTGKQINAAEALKSAVTVLLGKDLEPDSKMEYDQRGKPEIAFAIKGEANQQHFGAMTEGNLERKLAIVLGSGDSAEIVSAPVIKARIDRSGVITGNFTVQQATDMATLFNAGALPVKVQIVENRTVSASLGADSVRVSLIAGIIGLALVLIFMIAYYRLPGIMASLALIVYIFLSLAVLHAFDSALTLPGIAGVIISIGMAVDANVIIFERLKEELRTQKPLETAIDVAFSRAWTAILDSNVASIITGFVLYWLGTGAVQNFAITLLIGVIVSLFTAVTVTRLFMKLMIRSKAGHKLSWYGV